MLRSLWTAKTGMEAQQTQLDVISHNLANVATNGYKKSHVTFNDLLYQTQRQAGANNTEQTTLPTGLQVGLGVGAGGTAPRPSQGRLTQNAQTQDGASQGNRFFQIQMPDGTTAYTRDGNFQLDANGQVVTNDGNTVLPGIIVPADAKSVTIGADGTVSVTTAASATPTTLGQLQLANFINPPGLESLGGNLYAETVSSGTPQTGAPGQNSLGTVQQGFVETSNVNVVEELVQMIQTQRAYEMNSKAIQTSDQMLQKLSQI